MFEIETTMLVASPDHQKQVAIAFEKHGYLIAPYPHSFYKEKR